MRELLGVKEVEVTVTPKYTMNASLDSKFSGPMFKIDFDFTVHFDAASIRTIRMTNRLALVDWKLGHRERVPPLVNTFLSRSGKT